MSSYYIYQNNQQNFNFRLQVQWNCKHTEHEVKAERDSLTVAKQLY